jgi:ribosome-binding protein aMBF1 (putative translation factor)
MKFNSIEEIQKVFVEAIKKSDEKEDIQSDTLMISYSFLSEIEILTEERKMSRKELAQKIGTSASYITQLYRGTKLLNLTTIAKLEKVFDITFGIKAIPNFHKKSSEKGDLRQVKFSTGDNNELSPAKAKVKAIQSLVAQEPSKKYPKRKRDK